MAAGKIVHVPSDPPCRACRVPRATEHVLGTIWERDEGQLRWTLQRAGWVSEPDRERRTRIAGALGG